MRKVFLSVLYVALISFSFSLTGIRAQAMSTPAEKAVALTFDADMTYGMLKKLRQGKIHSWYDKRIVDELVRTETKATIFLTGLWVETYPNAAMELSENPLFEIGNHSYSHRGFTAHCYNLPSLPEKFDAREVQKTDDLLKVHTIAYKKYFRFPGFCHDADDIKTVESLGYSVIGGDVGGGDVRVRNPNRVVESIVRRVRPGSIIVLHLQGGPSAPATAEALPTLIKLLKEKGYVFQKVSELPTR